MKIIISTLITILSFSVYSAKDPVVATVNGKTIKKSELNKYYKDNLKYINKKTVTIESSLNDLINKIVGIEKAKKNKLQNDPIVSKKMDEILYHAQISKDLEGTLLKLANKKILDTEVKSYYKNNKEYRTAQILYRLRAVPSPDEVQKGYKQMLTLYDELKKKPDTFTDLASRFSQSTTAQTGGDLGFQPAARLSPEYFQKIKGKVVGTITKPFRTQFGYHVVKVLGIKKYDQIDKNVYKKLIYDQKRDKILKDYFENLRAKANIKINKKHIK